MRIEIDRLVIESSRADGEELERAIRAEHKIQLEDALNTMDPVDCEVLVLRHFEQLSNTEAATELGIEESAASKRYIRALKKLKGILERMPGELS